MFEGICDGTTTDNTTADNTTASNTTRRATKYARSHATELAIEHTSRVAQYLAQFVVQPKYIGAAIASQSRLVVSGEFSVFLFTLVGDAV
jgi:hypothetical protein